MLNPYVNTFIQVADSGSFSSASEKLYLSKVSVMNQINSLESRIGVQLFRRTHQGVSLTEAGKVFYKSALELIHISENIVHETRKTGGITSNNIKIGTSIMRPCNRLVELWEEVNTDNLDYQFSIVPFNDDDMGGLNAMLSSIGKTIDCFVTPCGSTHLLMNYSFLPFTSCRCAVAMSRKHPLARKDVLNWKDLENQSLLLMRRGGSYVLDEMRDDILCNHSGVNIVDFDGYYDISAFNLCEQQGYLMETLDIWSSLHPSLITLPVNWSYEMPYGILYEKEPSDIVKSFIDIIAKAIKFL